MWKEYRKVCSKVCRFFFCELPYLYKNKKRKNMYKFTTLLLPFCFVVLSNCASDKPSTEDTVEQEASQTEQTTEAADPEPPATLNTPTVGEKEETESDADQDEETSADSKIIDHPIQPGKHSFTLQWIGWDTPGQVEVEFLSDNKYSVKGEQKGTENDDFASIDGVLTWEGNQTFQFDGEIISRVSYVNGGETCVKKGPVHFRATGKRKYWRLQEKDNCEEGNVVDYFDIYF